MITKKIMIALVVGGMLAGVSAIIPDSGAGASAGASPRADAAVAQQVLNAEQDPAGAAMALNDFCDPVSNCEFSNSVPTVQYGAPRTIGDALYNCGATYAEDSVEISDERSNSVSLQQSLNTSITVGIVKAEAEIFTGQREKVTTTLGQSEGVAVAPGWKGWIDTQVPTVTGSVSLTSNIHLLQISNVDLSYPGYGSESINKLFFTGVHDPFSTTNPDDQKVHCGDLEPPLTLPPGALGSGPASGLPISICTSSRRCTTRHVITSLPPVRPNTNVALARGSRIYASGIAGRKGIVLRARRLVGAGTYLLLLSGPAGATMRQVTVR